MQRQQAKNGQPHVQTFSCLGPQHKTWFAAAWSSWRETSVRNRRRQLGLNVHCLPCRPEWNKATRQRCAVQVRPTSSWTRLKNVKSFRVGFRGDWTCIGERRRDAPYCLGLPTAPLQTSRTAPHPAQPLPSAAGWCWLAQMRGGAKGCAQSPVPCSQQAAWESTQAAHEQRRASRSARLAHRRPNSNCACKAHTASMQPTSSQCTRVWASCYSVLKPLLSPLRASRNSSENGSGGQPVVSRSLQCLQGTPLCSAPLLCSMHQMHSMRYADGVASLVPLIAAWCATMALVGAICRCMRPCRHHGDLHRTQQHRLALWVAVFVRRYGEGRLCWRGCPSFGLLLRHWPSQAPDCHAGHGPEGVLHR